MTYTVLGAGLMGEAVVLDFIENTDDDVLLVDINEAALARIVSKINNKRLRTQIASVLDKEQLRGVFDQSDIVVGAVTHSAELSNAVTLMALEAKKHLIDLCPRGWEDRMAYDRAAKNADIEILIGLGVAPGLSNILVSYAISKLDEVDSVVIRCGGLPVDYPVPPLDYRITFGFEGLNFLYTRHPKVIKDYEITEILNLSDVEVVEYPQLGRLEAVTTDGLTTLAQTMHERGVKNVAEKTIRRPGHIEKIKTLIDVGLWDDKPVDGIAPRQYLADVLKPKVTMKPEHRDLTILHVNATGRNGNTNMGIDLLTIDYYDDDKKITSMGRTTGFPATIAAMMLKSGMIKARGVTPLEKVFVDGCAEYMIQELKKRGIEFTETITQQTIL